MIMKQYCSRRQCHQGLFHQRFSTHNENLSKYSAILWKTVIVFLQNTVKFCYNAVQFIMILHTALQWQQQNMNETWIPQQTPHSSPWWASYGVSVVWKLEKIDSIIMAPHCMAHGSEIWRVCEIKFWYMLCCWHIAVLGPLLLTKNIINSRMDK